MPAVTKPRTNRHSQTPYARKTKPAVQHHELQQLATVDNGGMLKSAIQGLSRLVSWVFPRVVDTSGKSSAIVRNEESSGFEHDSNEKHNEAQRSMLAADLAPHYLGKTPQAVRVRQQRATTSRPTMNGPTIRSFSNSQFKIPDIPSPRQDLSPSDTKMPSGKSSVPAPSRNLKALEVRRRDPEYTDHQITSWLTHQRNTPSERPRSESESHMRASIDSAPRLQAQSEQYKPTHHEEHPPQLQKHIKRSVSNMSLDTTSVKSEVHSRKIHKPNGKSADELTRHTTSSSGILSAWREVCERREVQNRKIKLSIDKSLNPRMQSDDQWHDQISFSMPDVNDDADSQAVVEKNTGSERYWGPLRSYPMAENSTTAPSISGVTQQSRPVSKQHRRAHSRQASLARRPRRSSDAAKHRGRSSRRSQEPETARPRSLQRAPSQTSQATKRKQEDEIKQKQASQNETEKVHSQDMLRHSSPSPQAHVPPQPEIIITKERRKRAGCFSALEEDLEEIYGPYAEVLPKRPKVNDSPFLFRPRVPLLHDSEEVLHLRREQKASESIAANASHEAAGDVAVKVTSANPAAILTVPNAQSNQPSSVPWQASTLLPASVTDLASADINNMQQERPMEQTTESSSTQPFKFGFSAPSKANENSFAVVPEVYTSSKNEEKPKPVFSFSMEGKAKPVSGTTLELAAQAGSDKAAHTATKTADPPVFSFTPVTRPIPTDVNSSNTKITLDTNNKFGFSQPRTGLSEPLKSSDSASNAKTSNMEAKSGILPAAVSQSKPLGFADIFKVNDGSTVSAPSVQFGGTTTTLPQKSEKDPEIAPKLDGFQFGSSNSASTKDAPSFSFGTASKKSDGLQGPEPMSGQPAFTMPTTNTIATSPFTFGAGVKSDAEQGSLPPNTTLPTSQTSSQSQEPFANLSKPTITGFNFGTTNASTAETKGIELSAVEPTKPTFSFGAPSSATVKETSNSIFGAPSTHQTISAAGGSAGTSNTTGSFQFGQAASNTIAPVSSAETPAQTSFSFGQPSAPTPTQNSTLPGNTGFNFAANVATNGPASTSTPAFSFGGASQTSAAPFSFGAPASTGFGGFNNTASPVLFGTQTNNAFGQGGAVAPQTAQSFAFGQTQTAPNSGFASPAVQSPALQSATVPGSPNAFTFNMGAAGQASGGANGRKIAQPRSRRPRK